MRNLLNFLARYNNLIIFLLFEGFALYLLATGNNYHNARIVNSFRSMTHGFEERINNTRNYLSLRDINETLASENVLLRNQIKLLEQSEDSLFFSVTDLVYRQKYIYTSAEVINNSINRQKNYYTLNKGNRHGLKVNMAVTSDNGVAGVIVGCSDNYSFVMSLLNLDFKLSVRLKSNGYFGSLSWDGLNYSRAVLNEIPQHVIVSVGDTVETTGYSAIFPEGLIVGKVSDFEKIGSDFYKINIALKTDFRKIHYVSVIGNMRKSEQFELENLY
jgi:rod shape-determining protein MreC